MRIVTVSRKPCVEGSTTANVLRWEAGALNIDRCRVGWQSERDMVAGRPGSGPKSHVGFEGKSFAMKDRTHRDPKKVQHQSGRWPANLILVHQPDCEITGERKVPTGTAHRERSGGKTIFSETDKKPLPNMTYADEDGKETIAAWACKPGCPVRELGDQSGNLDSGGPSRNRGLCGPPDVAGDNQIYGTGLASSKPKTAYAGVGTAARFFKQVKP